MKLLSFLTLTAMLSLAACSHMKSGCGDKDHCKKDSKSCCKDKGECKDGHCAKKSEEKKAEAKKK